MNWLGDIVKNSIWSFILDLIQDILSKAFSLVSDLILQASDINKYLNISVYLSSVQAIAGGLLVLAVTWEATKQLSGKVLPTSEKSIGQLAGQTLVAGFLIFFLPWSVNNVFLKINNALVGLIQGIGVNIDMTNLSTVLRITSDPVATGGVFILLTLVVVIGILVLGVTAGIRYIELIIIILISPIVAISAVKNYDAIQIWIRETIAVVFTQSIQLLLLQLMMVVLINVTGIMGFLLTIGCLVVALRGPQVLRQFLYSSGTGSALVGAAGSAGRMAVMKFMFKAAK